MAGPIGGTEQAGGANGLVQARKELLERLREARSGEQDQQKRLPDDAAKRGIRTLSLMDPGRTSPATGGRLDVFA